MWQPQLKSRTLNKNEEIYIGDEKTDAQTPSKAKYKIITKADKIDVQIINSGVTNAKGNWN